MRKISYLGAIACLSILVSCGTAATVAEQPEAVVELPGIEEAAALVSSLATVPAQSQTIPFQTGAGPRVFCFYPQSGSDNLSVLTLAPVDGQWQQENVLMLPCFEADGTAFKEFTAPISVQAVEEKDFVVLKALREDGSGKAQRSVIMFDPEAQTLQAASFCGKYLADGRIEGSSYLDSVASVLNPELAYARGVLVTDSTLVELSRADEMTDQAIDWWLKNNPRALTNASSISYGAVNAESSLVEAFRKAKKESSANYSAALFDIRGYTVIVVQRKSNGSYVLAWAEPVCVNKNRDRLLNSIYFRNASNLTMFYYKGKSTFNYQLNLANGRLMK